MMMPESERAAAIKKGLEMLKDPETRVIAASVYGAVIEDKFGNRLTITMNVIDFDPPK